jgi:hypothetical protein
MPEAHRRGRHPVRAGRGLVAGSAVLAAVLGSALGGCTSGSPGPAASGSGGRAPVASASGNGGLTPATAPEVVPPYYAEATAARSPAYRSPDNISIRDTGTGTVVATVKPPRQYQTFGYVFAASRPDTWVAGAQPWHPARLDDSAQPVTLFTLSFSPATRRVAMARLPAPPVPGTDLAAVALSPDGSRLAEVTLAPGRPVRVYGSTYLSGSVWLRVYTMTGGAVRSSSRELATTPYLTLLRGYSLTWLDDGRTLAIGGNFGPVGASTASYPDTVVYVGTSSSAAPAVTRTIHLSFPAATGAPSSDIVTSTNWQCTRAPIATSDGQAIICGGTAATVLNEAGYTNVGIWSFSAQTGKLTAAWDRHGICCAIEGTMFPAVLWASPSGGVIVATGLNMDNQGANLYIRMLDGRFRQVPWPGLFYYPGIVNVVEPPVAW